MSISGKVDYVFEKNKTPVGYRTTLSNLVAAHQWYNSKTYFFDSNSTYTRYNKILDKADSGYPAEVNNHNWPGLEPYNKMIRASFLANNNTVYYFLSDGTFINYDTQADTVRDGFPKIIDESTWPGLQNYAKRITAALKWQGERVYLFLNDGTYLRINLSNNTLDSGYPKTINNANWPGLEPYAKNIQSALKWDDTRGYLFLNNAQYIRYNITLDKVDSYISSILVI